MKLHISILVAFALSAMFSEHLRADLRPNEIAIIAKRGSKGSERLAEYYAKQRGIPQENICKIVVPTGETISHEKWRWAVRPEIRKWLQENDPDRDLRCLVTTWDIPLRIGRDKKDNPRLSRYQKYLEGERATRIKLLRDLKAEFSLLAPGIGVVDESDNEAPSGQDPSADAELSRPEQELEELTNQLERELQNAQARIRQLTDQRELQQATAKVQRYATTVGGIRVLMDSLYKRIQAESEQTTALQVEYERLRGMLVAYAELQMRLDRSAPNTERDAMLLEIMTRSSGMVATIKWIDKQLATARDNETHSSFDSELSLILWPDDDYQLLRWQPNYLRPEYDNSQLRNSFPTLMVSRLDGPSLELIKKLIDTSIRIENMGLQGKVYLDTRGIGSLDQANVQPGSFADYDRALLITAKGMQEQTNLDVTLNEEKELFQAGECPDAALYCGWYSLGKYVDAFDWAPGAVAYHLASGEARTLRDKDSNVWCKRLLEDGVCATIGPTFEPYLIAFPRPNDFFALLVQGELSLVECYYRTKPFNSWMMILVGDPLYRPFANRVVRK